jgi:MFS transporter, FSR family, fosmidomycin resistance protein
MPSPALSDDAIASEGGQPKSQSKTFGAWATLSYYCIGHFFIDLYSNALGVFAPVLVERMGISLTQAGFLGGLMSFSSSVTQPLYGYLSDRFGSPLFATLAPALAGIFISSLGLAPNYAWLVFLVFMGGAGIASFHPAGSARAAVGLEAKRQQAMAIFISSGTLGLAFGPSFYSFLFETIGFERAHYGELGGILATVVMMIGLPKHDNVHASRGGTFDLEPLKAVWKPLTILYFCVFLRSMVQIAFSSFLPLYLHRERGLTLTEASHVLSIYLASGAVGGLMGGNLADRFGPKRVIQASFLGSVPLLSLFFFAQGWIANAGLMLGGLILLFTIPVNVVMAQQLAPTQTGTVSSLMMGASWGMAGLIAIPIIGWAGDHTSLHAALASLLVAPALGFLLTLGLAPDHNKAAA